MTDALFLSWRALRAAPGRMLVLVFGVAVALAWPLLTAGVGWLAEDALLARARATPIVVGRKGDTHDLVLGAVYFRGDVAEPLSEAELPVLKAVSGSRPVPLHLGHSAGGIPVVGTTLAYLDHRGLAVASGRVPAVLGEVVMGSSLAAAGFGVGDHIRSDVRDPYDLAGAFPLLLKVVGVLAPTGGPDDEVFLADLKTSWVLDGLMHGHEGIGAADALRVDDELVVAAPSLFLFAEISDDNLGSFHLHGGPEDRPISAVLLFPEHARAHDQVLGAVAVDPRLQAVRPETVVRGILAIVLRVQAWLAAGVALVIASTVAFVASIAVLSWRLREDELRLMRRLGASPARIRAVLGFELLLVGTLGSLLAVGLSGAVLALLQRALGV